MNISRNYWRQKGSYGPIEVKISIRSDDRKSVSPTTDRDKINNTVDIP